MDAISKLALNFVCRLAWVQFEGLKNSGLCSMTGNLPFVFKFLPFSVWGCVSRGNNFEVWWL